MRQSMSRGRMSFAYPTQQVFEETRSILHDGGQSVAELSEFEMTLQRNRRMSMMPVRGNEDYIEGKETRPPQETILELVMYVINVCVIFPFLVMESLHEQFGVTIQSMTDVSQMFSVIGGWVEVLQIAMQYQKTNQTDISDANYRKVIFIINASRSLGSF